jgi:hypothetical protein
MPRNRHETQFGIRATNFRETWSHGFKTMQWCMEWRKIGIFILKEGI